MMGFPDSSVGKESIHNAGEPGSIPGLGRSAEEGIGFPCGSAGKESACNAGDLGSNSRLERSKLLPQRDSSSIILKFII